MSHTLAGVGCLDECESRRSREPDLRLPSRDLSTEYPVIQTAVTRSTRSNIIISPLIAKYVCETANGIWQWDIRARNTSCCRDFGIVFAAGLVIATGDLFFVTLTMTFVYDHLIVGAIFDDQNCEVSRDLGVWTFHLFAIKHSQTYFTQHQWIWKKIDAIRLGIVKLLPVFSRKYHDLNSRLQFNMSTIV